MIFKYEVGMRVRSREFEEDKGEITEVEDDGEVRVLWDDAEEPRWAETRDLMPDTPEAVQKLAALTKKIQLKVDEATSLLDQAFKLWRQANAMQFEGTENPGPDDGYFEGAYALRGNPDLDLSKFEDVVEQNGWSTSSLYC